jgi:hypothetical protein
MASTKDQGKNKKSFARICPVFRNKLRAFVGPARRENALAAARRRLHNRLKIPILTS